MPAEEISASNCPEMETSALAAPLISASQSFTRSSQPFSVAAEDISRSNCSTSPLSSSLAAPDASTSTSLPFTSNFTLPAPDATISSLFTAKGELPSKRPAAATFISVIIGMDTETFIAVYPRTITSGSRKIFNCPFFISVFI